MGQYGPATPLGGGRIQRLRVRFNFTADAAGGLLLLVAAIAALGWANSPWRDVYHELLDAEFGPAGLHLHLSLGQWASDGLLAIFFFAVGVELRHEFTAGSLRDLRSSAVPIAAAVGGMVVPALVYMAVVAPTESAAMRGWAIPTATDIAFALAVLGVFGSRLPVALRLFLMTLAVVDDLLGILVIALVYTDSIDLPPLFYALAVIVIFGLLVRLRRPPVWLLIPLGIVAWALLHASGVHATVAGVLLGATVPAVSNGRLPRTVKVLAVANPVSSLVALPLFAFAAAGVTVVGLDRIVDPAGVGAYAGLVIGKVIGVLGTTALVVRFTPLRLPAGIGVRDLLPVGLLTGIGFTVALLIAELSFPEGSASEEHLATAKLGILLGSLTAAAVGGWCARRDSRIRHPE